MSVPSDEVSILTCSEPESIRTALSQLGQQERAVTAKLDALIATQRDLVARQLTRLDLARAQLSPQVVLIRSLSNGMLSSAASTASRISTAVKRLDDEQSAVKATLEVVRQVAELKSCVLGVHASMGALQDWETAATYLHRARRIPDDVITSPFAEDMVPTAEVPGSPTVTLNEAAEGLCHLFLREFDKAAREGDGTRVTRFFKLFPLIGRETIGLDAYGRYVCGGVATRAREVMAPDALRLDDDAFYARALTKLFEHIAQIVDGHEPIVTRHYGPGTMTKVIQRLQVEADVQGGLVLDAWAEEKGLSQKITQVKSYAFAFLVQSFLQQQPNRKSDFSDPSGSGEDVDMKVCDALLVQMALMLGRWGLYTKFIAMKTRTFTDNGLAETALTIPSLIVHSNLNRKVVDTLVEPFNVMCTFFVRRSIEMSFQLDEAPDLHLNMAKALGSNPPFITSVVDDVMYIVNQVLQRALGTCHRVVAAGVVPSIARVLGSDFYGMIQRKMRDESYPKATVQGSLPPENVIVSFIVLTNNLDVSTDYVRRIVGSALAPAPATNGHGHGHGHGQDGTPTAPVLATSFPFDDDALDVEAMLSELQHGFESKTTELINEATAVLLKHVLRPRLRTVLNEAFRHVEYMCTSADFESEHLVIQRFERGWSAFMLPIKRIATERNYERFLKATIQQLAKMLEKRIWTFYGRVNELGAVRMERDVTGLVQVAVQGGRYELRDEFARCTQMMLIINMDDDEWADVATSSSDRLGDTGVVWQLDMSERANTRAIIKDLAK